MEKQLPPSFEKRKIALPLGLEGFAWERETILEFLGDSSAKSFAILGGDVYKRARSALELAYANWHVSKREPNESFESYCARSASKAQSYIENYPASQDVVFAPVITSEVTAGL
jgi:hypothetical protein